jgi:hypothetical protein
MYASSCGQKKLEKPFGSLKRVVSSRLLHKSDVGGVVVGIGSDEKL